MAVDGADVFFDELHGVAHVLLLLLLLGPKHVQNKLGLGFNVALDDIGPSLHVNFLVIVVVFLLSDHEYLWEELLVFEFLRLKVCFSLPNHHNSLMIIICNYNQ